MRALALLLLLLLLARPAAAWLPEGHLATGAMVFDALERTDPEALRTVLRAMPAHPDRPWFERELGALAGRERDRRTLELMAIWPDVARGGPLDHDDWHYSQAIVSAVGHLVPTAFGGAERAFQRNLVLARDPGAAAADRALAFCWVLHIVGDMHQPLHAAVWLSWRFPLSDAGGNWAWVRRAEGAAPERLHFFWDSAGRPRALSRASPDALVARLEAERPFESEPPVTDPWAAFDGWARHSRVLAYRDVYEEGRLRPGVGRNDAPVLTPAYVERTRAVGEGQIAAAGNRAARLLVGIR